jgi:hypothetical protein
VEVAICLIFVAYLTPFVVAARREHERIGAILALNLLLGWTGIGWLLALRWARRPALPVEPPAVSLRRGHLRLLESPPSVSPRVPAAGSGSRTASARAARPRARHGRR